MQNVLKNALFTLLILRKGPGCPGLVVITKLLCCLISEVSENIFSKEPLLCLLPDF